MPLPPRPGVARVLAGTVLVLAVLVSTAGPAFAHAVLLRTDPAPQTTVKTAPAAVRLDFSEAVEVAFGAVRVFDVDGRRVDQGRITTANGRREVVVPASLKDGTYTVTWRVVSADGHPVHGGFQFYVGAPSTISAVAVKGDSGAGRLIGWGYGVARFCWYAALLAVIGLIVVRRFVWTPALAAAGLADRGDANPRFRARFNRVLPWAWRLLLVAWLAVLVFQAASISGLGLARSAGPAVLRDVLRTGFGRAWLYGFAFIAVLGFPVTGLTRARGLFGARPQTWLSVTAATAAGLALASANIGHARTESHPGLAVPSVAIHLLAVSTWVGGLGALVAVGAAGWTAVPAADRNAVLGQIVRRFSQVALVAVAVIVATGTLNSFLDLASVSDLWDTTYGRVLATKIVLLAVALAFGAWHLWGVPRRLGRTDPAATASRSFRRSSGLEMIVLAGAVAAASALVALVPGRSLALASRGPVNEEQRAGTYTVQLFIDPSGPGANQVHLTFVDPSGLGAAEVTVVTGTLAPAAGGGAAPAPATPALGLRLISPGHFVADTDLAAGRYRLDVSAPLSPPVATTFEFTIRAGGVAG
ncbi:MAG TPA: copper resistance protein CopC [Acidimicrobiia bacterium]|nr:copper resistance protein CopC [Acidimicrobiia bacterium]